MAQGYRLIGKDFQTPDAIAKVTGQARFAEDYRVDGMLFAKLFLSPMPHGRVRRIDPGPALAMPGVQAVLTPDEVPQVRPPGQPALASEPLFVGEPIAAVAAVDEQTAADAVARLRVDLQPLPFVLDPLESLRPGAPNARSDGNAPARIQEQVRGTAETVTVTGVTTIKWSARDFAGAGPNRLPMGQATEEWSYGDVEGGLAAADLVVDETFVLPNHAHHCQETRTALAYWMNGKLYLHASLQSLMFSVPAVAGVIGIDPSDLVLISVNTGGGFGSKAISYVQLAIPALLAKKTGRPVMLRVSRAEEFYFGGSRPGYQARARVGFRKDGRVTAVDLFVVNDGGAYGYSDYASGFDAASLVYQPPAMRARGISVFTNTPPKTAFRGPGTNQVPLIFEPILDRAARQLDLDRVEIRRVNAPRHDGKIGHDRLAITSSYLPEALDKGAQLFGWGEKKSLSGRRDGPRVTGVGVGTAFHSAGASGFDGLVLIKPDGKLSIHNGMGNLGTLSYAATARVAAEVLGVPWDQVEVHWGDTRRNLPWNAYQAGSNSSFTMTRTNYVAAMDAKQKLQEIAAKDLGGSPADYDVADGRVFQKADPARSLTLAQAAARAIELGGRYSGEELPADLNPLTLRSAQALAGQGLLGVAKDVLPRNGLVPAFASAFAQVEVDTETGHVAIVDAAVVADCGTVLHPTGLWNQLRGGAIQGFGYALSESHLIDRQYGIPLNASLYLSKPPTFLDVPPEIKVGAVDQPDPQNPVGAKGVGEPPMGAAAAAIVSAVEDALGVPFNRTPITPDMILRAVERKAQPFGPLEVNVVA
ncbi:xanthine dehydrogenase family protein molybdopterin-binding subunit [Limnochorda pilosa]|uniref:Aldehyde oxidase n=1 Tax=Limnochorda pilosa TaxID=1555112 RepID=A0A0K2SNN0_LIMPI|nr:xanthine dehydrogenase family protein molybdopterin-binding subunit [Limnochorda pilosa]BAS28738.1 aldehyde oxidase [Limnochorda pilosa]